MRKIKKSLKYILNVGFIALICWLTFRLLFSGQEFSQIISDLRIADKRWLAAGAVLTFMFVSGESWVIYYMLGLFGQKTRFCRCLKYSFIGFFFSYITPSSSGGQPAQMYYMKKDGIKIGFSTLIMLVITVAYKSVLVILGGVFLIFNFDYVRLHMGGVGWLLTLGFFLNAAFIAALAFIFFKPSWARKMGIRLVNFLTGRKLVKPKNNEKYVSKITRICDTYTMGTSYIKENLHTVLNVFIITVVQRLSLFAVTWAVYKSYGLSGASLAEIVCLQVMVAVSVEMLPLPGAAGITEGCFVFVFDKIFGSGFVKPALLLSRGLTFYAVLIVGGIVTLAAHILVVRSDKKMLSPDNNTGNRSDK